MMKRINLEVSNRQKFVKFIKFGLALLFVVLFVEIWLSSRLATSGEKIQQLKTAQAELRLENQALENDIAHGSSLVRIEPKTQSLGFGTVKNVEYYKAPNLAATF